MKRLGILLLLFIPLIGFAETRYAIVVSAHSTIESMEADKIKDIFLKKRNFDGHTKLLPINLIGDEAVRLSFESEVLQMDRSALKRYWVKNHFQGISPPPTQASLDSVKSFVERVEGALGYLPMEMVDEGLKVIYEF